MSNDAASVLSVARGQIGYSRWSDPEAGTRYGRWYAKKTGNSYYGQSGVPYCAMFASYVFDKAGASCAGLPGAYCPTMLSAASGHTVTKKQARPGDVVYFDWGGDGVVDHVGIVEANNGSYLTTIEGNTSSGASGSQGNGGGVYRRTRSFGVVRAVVRPSYGGASKPASGSASASKGTVEVDGWWGSATTRLAQKVAGTPVDGVVSSQNSAFRGHLKGCSGGWEFTRSPKGSALVRAIQRKLGVAADGIVGKATVNAFIKRYGNGVCDGRLDGPSTAIKGFQRSINAGHL